MSLLLHASSITKSFDGTRVLRGVLFDLLPGEVHALVGENGAGKSTLLKIITGAESGDAGMLMLGGQIVRRMDPATARALGVAAIYQQPALFPHLTVAENIALALESGRPWTRVDWPARRRTAAALLARLEVSIDPDRLAETLSMPEQQLVEIAKALGADAKIVIMDEPTASLADREVEHLFGVIRRLRANGVGIVYVSHRLEELFAIADRLTVLRDGETVATRRRDEIDRDDLIALMVGRSLNVVFPKRRVAIGDVALEVRGLTSRAAGVRNVSFAVRRGEILGVAGLVGSGRTELAEAIFGVRTRDAGEIRVNETPATIESPADAIRLGIAYLPEDRRRHGVVLPMSIEANVSLANLKAVSRNGLINRSAERNIAGRFIDQLRVKTRSPADEVASLSGGNQQKVAIARWLATAPSVMILDEPTQGVDVGSKAEIHAIMEDLAERGVALVMISSELPEVLGMSDRVLVMRAGEVAGIVEREDATQPRVMALALGHAQPS